MATMTWLFREPWYLFVLWLFFSVGSFPFLVLADSCPSFRGVFTCCFRAQFVFVLPLSRPNKESVSTSTSPHEKNSWWDVPSAGGGISCPSTSCLFHVDVCEDGGKLDRRLYVGGAGFYGVFWGAW